MSKVKEISDKLNRLLREEKELDKAYKGKLFSRIYLVRKAQITSNINYLKRLIDALGITIPVIEVSFNYIMGNQIQSFVIHFSDITMEEAIALTKFRHPMATNVEAIEIRLGIPRVK